MTVVLVRREEAMVATSMLPPDWLPMAESEARYRLLAENASDTVALAQPDGTIAWVSDSVTAMLGWQPSDLVGRKAIDLIHPDDVGAVVAGQSKIESGNVVQFQARIRRPDGDYRWVASRVRPVFDETGTLIARVAGWRDVSEEHAAQEALAVSEARYRMLAENASDIVYESGPDRLLRWIAPSVERVLGWSPEELVGMAFVDLVHPDDQRIVEPDRERMYAGESLRVREARYTLRVRSKDGRYLWFSTIGTPILDAGGKAAGMIGGLKLVDDLVAERQRAKSEAERRQAILDTLLDPYVLMQAVRDDAGTIVDFVYMDANDAACEYNQTPREQLIGARLLDLLPGHAGTGLLAMYSEALESGKPVILNDYTYAHEILGSERRLDIRATRVGDALSFTWRDVTERYEAAQQLAASEELLRVNADAVVDPLVLLQAMRDPETNGVIDFRYLDVNPAACTYLSMSREDLIGRGLLELSPGLLDSGMFSLYRQAIEEDAPTSVDEFRYDNEIINQIRYYDIRARRVSGDRLSLTWRDVTDRHHSAERIAAAEEQYRLLADNSADIVLRVRDNAIVWISNSVTASLGGMPDEWIGVQMVDFVHPEDMPTYVESLAAVEAGDTVVRRARVRAHGDGYRWVEVHAKTFIDANGQPDGVVASMREVEAEVAAEKELERLARFDVLTGVLNRAEGLARVAAATAQPRHPGKANGVLFCDVDMFKDINDAHGHAAGDLVLSTLTARIIGCVRQEDIVARMGGDEFLVFLAGIHDVDEAATIAEKLRSAASEPIALPNGRRSVLSSLSIGVALAVPGESTDDLIARADTAMYAAKKGGRNKVTLIR